MVKKYPEEYDAPIQVLRLEGGCGVIAAWSVFKYFHRRVSSTQLIKACHYTKTHGVFTVAMAIAIQELGLSVSFYTDPDPSPKPIEKRCYKIAESRGLAIMPAIELDTVIERVDTEHIAIVLYKEKGGAHFSPLLGVKDNKLLLPYSSSDDVKKEKFIEAWNDPEICRQCIIAARK